MTTPYVDKYRLTAKTNEAVNEIIRFITIDDEGTVTPLDLSGLSFFGQARTAKSAIAPLMCNIQIQPWGDPKLGLLHFYVSEEVTKDIAPIKGHYDVLVRSGSGPVDNLYMAPFIITQGVSVWTTE